MKCACQRNHLLVGHADLSPKEELRGPGQGMANRAYRKKQARKLNTTAYSQSLPFQPVLVAVVDRVLEDPRHGRPVHHAALPAFARQQLLGAGPVVLGRLPNGHRVQPPRELGFVGVAYGQFLRGNRFDAFGKNEKV